MKKRFLAIILCVIFSVLLSVSVFATGDIGIIGGAEGETQILVGNDEYIVDDSLYTDGYIDEDFNDIYDSSYYTYFEDEEFMDEVVNNPGFSMFADEEEVMQMLYEIGLDNMVYMGVCGIIAILSSLMFLPLLILLIVFAVLNSKAKKKIKELEMKANPAYSYAYSQKNSANLNYQPQPVAEAQKSVESALPQDAENTNGGEEKWENLL